MTVPRRSLVSWLPAAAGLITAVAAAAYAWQTDLERARRLDRITGDLRQVGILAAEHQTLTALRDRYREHWAGPALPDQLAAAFPGRTTRIDLREALPAGEGWALRRYDITVEALPSAEMDAWLTWLADTPVPRQVSGIHLTPVPGGEDLRCRVTVLTIERQEETPRP